jgi:hypothetical protein
VSEKSLSTTREALIAELLIDVDRLLTKVGDLDQSLGNTIEKATKDAANKGFLSASLQIKRLTEDLEIKIEHACLRAGSGYSQRESPNITPVASSSSSMVHLKLFAFCTLGGLMGGLMSGLISGLLRGIS